MERRKLFSENKERRKLFSSPDAPQERNIKLFSETAEEEAFQRTFSATSDELELKLKEYSGQTLNAADFASIFGGENLSERYYTADTETGDVSISPEAFMESRLFSKLTISVTKTLELDGNVMGEPKEEVISRLEDSGRFSPKTIILLKKAHNIPADGDSESYLKDSGIAHDLPFEFGGRKMEMPEFENILKERYEDAPTDIMDILKNKGILKIDGENVEIIK